MHAPPYAPRELFVAGPCLFGIVQYLRIRRPYAGHPVLVNGCNYVYRHDQHTYSYVQGSLPGVGKWLTGRYTMDYVCSAGSLCFLEFHINMLICAYLYHRYSTLNPIGSSIYAYERGSDC